MRRASMLPWVLGAAYGALLATVDTSPGWDDTGISAGLMLIGCAAMGWARPRRPWLAALVVGAWLPLANIARRGNDGAAVAALVALLGAYAGALICRSQQPIHG